MRNADFEYVTQLVCERAGIVVKAGQHYLVENRLSPLVRELGLASIDEAVDRARAGAHAKVNDMIVDAMSTKESMFFRDRTPFDYLRTVVFPSLKGKGGQIRIWSAACSTGQEPYSIAMMLDHEPDLLGDATVEIVASDLSETALKQARDGLYSQFEVQRGLPLRLMMEYFVQDGARWRISESIREKVLFMRHNLMDSPANMGRFDIVMCRNVLTYFDKETKKKVIDMIGMQMPPGSYLFLGAAETAFNLTNIFSEVPAACGLYQRSSSSRAAA